MYTYIQSALSLFFYNPFLFLFLSAALLVIYSSILSSCPYSSELFPFFLLEGVFYHTSRTHTGGGGSGNELRICKKNKFTVACVSVTPDTVNINQHTKTHTISFFLLLSSCTRGTVFCCLCLRGIHTGRFHAPPLPTFL